MFTVLVLVISAPNKEGKLVGFFFVEFAISRALTNLMMRAVYDMATFVLAKGLKCPT